jgi:crotonobetainyl-CoA:carnitine CoA-transferase CaiB-like acyl-CoA transferase
MTTEITRRQFIETSGYSTLGVAIASALPVSNVAHAASGSPGFDIDRVFADFMADIGGSPNDAGGKVTFTGKDPLVRSHFRIASSMAIPAMGSGLGAASIWKDRTGQEQDVSVDLRESLYGVNPFIGVVQKMEQAAGLLAKDDPIPGSFTFSPSVNGLFYQAPLMIGHPLSFALFETKDNRWVTPTAAYPKLYDGFLNVIKASPNTESIAKAVKQWNGEELDEAVADAGFILGLHRSAEEWARHPEGSHLAKTPLIEIVKVGDADPLPYSPNPSQPLSGIKALSLTHVIAGSCAARTLAEQGAEVLHIARDQSVEHDFFVQDVNVGMRSSFLNLKNPEQNKQLASLVPECDVFIEGFRGRSIEKLGFGVDEVVAKRPGVIYLSMRCFSWDGPWSLRGGFDMEGLTVSGFTVAEGGGGKPQFPPTMVMNDYIAGYLAAAGTQAALRRQRKEGGSYHVRVNLTRAAMWYASLGIFDSKDGFDPLQPDHRMIDPRTIKRKTCYGEIHRLAPQAILSKTPGSWREPLVTVRGSSRPEWES